MHLIPLARRIEEERAYLSSYVNVAAEAALLVGFTLFALPFFTIPLNLILPGTPLVGVWEVGPGRALGWCVGAAASVFLRFRRRAIARRIPLDPSTLVPSGGVSEQVRAQWAWQAAVVKTRFRVMREPPRLRGFLIGVVTLAGLAVTALFVALILIALAPNL